MQVIAGGILDDRPIRPWQWTMLALVVGSLIIDGVDIQLLSLVAPVILDEWGIDRSVFGPALSAALIGLTLGAGIGGWLGDRFGRKTVLVCSTLFFGAATIAAGFTNDLWTLAALRLLSGLGFGAVAPNGAALVTEWLPTRIRTRVIPLLSITIPLGGLIGASAVLALLAAYGWRGVFMICGALTILYAAVLAGWLPEAPSYLVRKGRPDRAQRLLDRITPGVSLPPAAQEQMQSGSIFAREHMRFNIGAWLAYFCLQVVAYAFIAWAPVFFTVAGWPLEEALGASMVFNLSAIAAAIATGFLLMRFSFRPIILIGCVGSLASIVLIAATLSADSGTLRDLNRPLALLATGGAGAFSGAGICAIYTLLAFVYPVSCRASGIGMGLMMGRAGGIAISLIGGVLLAVDGDNLVPFFGALGVSVLAAIAGTFILGHYSAVQPRRTVQPPEPATAS